MSFGIMVGRRWTRDTVIAAILSEYHAGQDLCYSYTERRVPSLIRAATRIFGSWANAVTAAGLDYDCIRRYRNWSRVRVIERIRELHQAGADLSWRNLATKVDPALAAAALRAGRFDTWNDALRAAGLDPNRVARYRRWSLPKIREELRKLQRNGVPLDRETLVRRAPALLAAVYRVGNGLVDERQEMDRLAFPYAAVMQD